MSNRYHSYNNKLYCTLDEYAAYFGVTKRTAYNHYYYGWLKGAFKDVGGTNRILIPIQYIQAERNPNVTIYATVSAGREEPEKDMEAEVLKLRKYCSARGYNVQEIVSEYSYGILDERPKLNTLLKNRRVKHIVVANKSAVNYFSFDFISSILTADGRELEFMMTKEPEDVGEFKKDLIDTIYVCCKKLGSKQVSYEKVRKTMVALGLVERKNLGGRPRKDKKKDD